MSLYALLRLWSTTKLFEIFTQLNKDATYRTATRTLRITPLTRVAEVGGPQDRRSTKGQGLLRKEGPPTYAILLLSIVAIYALFERLS